MKIKHIILSMLAVSAAFMTSSCENGDKDFGDFDYQTVYFAKQSPVRTITLGEDVYSTDLDNAHDFEVYVTLGGVEKNKVDRKVTIAVDESLCTGKSFEDGHSILALPKDYYQLSSNELTISKGEVMGCVKVHLTDAFFNDPKSIALNYVLPLKIVSAGNDSILSTRNYTLYAVKYKNQYTGCWLSHGTDNIDYNGVKTTVTREPQYVEKYNLRYFATNSLKQCTYPITTTVTQLNSKGEDTQVEITHNLVVTFDDAGNCTLSSDDTNFVVSGTGKWTYHGAKRAWNDTDRDLIDLTYDATFKYNYGTEARYKKISTKESLIMRDRQSKFETFNIK